METEQQPTTLSFLRQHIDTGILIILVLLNLFWVSNYRGEALSFASNAGGIISCLLVAALAGWLIAKGMQSSFIKAFKRAGIVVIALLLLIMKSNEDFHSPASSNSTSTGSGYSSGTKTCAWCGNKFTGYGYYHVLDECREGDAENEGSMCSVKCCMENWNSQPHKRVDPTHL